MLIKCLWDIRPEQAETRTLSPSFIVLKILVDTARCTYVGSGEVSNQFVSYICNILHAFLPDTVFRT
jgi:hypothetical protein